MSKFIGHVNELAQHRHFDEIKRLFAADPRQEHIVVDTWNLALELGSVANAFDFVLERDNNDRTRACKVLEAIFTEDVDSIRTSKSYGDAIKVRIKYFLDQDISPSLREYLEVRFEKAIGLAQQEVTSHNGIRVIATHRDRINTGCVYAYTYGWFLRKEQYSPDAIIPIKVGSASNDGEERVAGQRNASTPEVPIVLMACHPKEGETALTNEKRLHAKILSSGFVATAGGGTEWFEISVRDLFRVAEESGLEPLEVTPPQDWK
ncbi:GIY-YIG nuclease family protein [Glutamicibacter sp.]|uniref:GIY-YIG nuclease family protein n=1 Tax=Glutamicibacter sp. TaxID=1931995 RepID=UPI003D6A6C96